MHANPEQFKTLAEADTASLIPDSYLAEAPFRFDFSKSNPDMKTINMMDADSLEQYVQEVLRKAGKSWGMGGYGEDRFFYQSSELFKKGDEYRTVHLGLDIWLPPLTQLRVPVAGVVHSVQDNNHFLDYGPTVILEHRIGDIHFFSLYGHLHRESVQQLSPGQRVNPGDALASVGDATENGGWAPHLHLQLMFDLLGNTGDFPGTATPSEKDTYLRNSPDPETLLSKFLATA